MIKFVPSDMTKTDFLLVEASTISVCPPEDPVARSPLGSNSSCGIETIFNSLLVPKSEPEKPAEFNDVNPSLFGSNTNLPATEVEGL